MGEHLEIGKRMKRYEGVTEYLLPNRIPVIVRIDGRAFHTFTRKFHKQWSEELANHMIATAHVVMGQMQGCCFCYGQSDEISFLLTDYRTIKTQSWFEYDLRKIISISAATASATLSLLTNHNIAFDSRAFSVPQDDVSNYFIWRQLDAIRNSTQFAASEYYSHEERENKNCETLVEMLKEKGINFEEYPLLRRRGFCISKKTGIDFHIPSFVDRPSYVNQHVYMRED